MATIAIAMILSMFGYYFGAGVCSAWRAAGGNKVICLSDNAVAGNDRDRGLIESPVKGRKASVRCADYACVGAC
jgi:hypothetical protein